MRKWLAWVAGLSAGAVAFATDTPPRPTPAFLALSQSEQNLAVYDAFWKAVRDHYYDAELPASDEWQSLRAEWRARAAEAPSTAELYRDVLGGIADQLPESHVSAEPPLSPPDPPDPTIGQLPSRRMERLLALLGSGTGHDWTEVRRGGRKFWLVNEVLRDSPAAEAGIRPGWRVISASSTIDVENEAVHFTGEFIPLDSAAAQAWERGQPAQEADQAHVVRIAFDHRKARRPRVETREMGDGVRYVRFDLFGDDRVMKPVFDAVGKGGDGGLILDLRWNGGGLTEQLQKLAGLLLGGSVPIGTFRNSLGIQPLVSLSPARQYEGPLVLLIGPGSASSSEMLAAAIQEQRSGNLVGRMTNGSALFSRLFPLPDNGLVLVPVSDFRTAANRRLEGTGVTPDIRVMPTLEDVRAGRDVAVERALAALRTARRTASTP
jgi:carboxyl-terminal processing protease